MVSKKRVVYATAGLLVAVSLMLPEAALAQSCYPTACPGPDAIALAIQADSPLLKNAENEVVVIGRLQGGPGTVTGSLTSTTIKARRRRRGPKVIANPVTPASITMAALDGETLTFLFTTAPKKPKVVLRGTTTAAGDINPSNDSVETELPVTGPRRARRGRR